MDNIIKQWIDEKFLQFENLRNDEFEFNVKFAKNLIYDYIEPHVDYDEFNDNILFEEVQPFDIYLNSKSYQFENNLNQNENVINKYFFVKAFPQSNINIVKFYEEYLIPFKNNFLKSFKKIF